jgi:hypothetical protein
MIVSLYVHVVDSNRAMPWPAGVSAFGLNILAHQHPSLHKVCAPDKQYTHTHTPCHANWKETLLRLLPSHFEGNMVRCQQSCQTLGRLAEAAKANNHFYCSPWGSAGCHRCRRCSCPHTVGYRTSHCPHASHCVCVRGEGGGVRRDTRWSIEDRKVGSDTGSGQTRRQQILLMHTAVTVAAVLPLCPSPSPLLRGSLWQTLMLPVTLCNHQSTVKHPTCLVIALSGLTSLPQQSGTQKDRKRSSCVPCSCSKCCACCLSNCIMLESATRQHLSTPTCPPHPPHLHPDCKCLIPLHCEDVCLLSGSESVMSQSTA